MTTSKTPGKPAPALWFYLFFALFVVFGLLVGITGHRGPLVNWSIGLVIAACGLPFLLEPLNRKNWLPLPLARWYDNFTSRSKNKTLSPKTMMFVLSMMSVVGVSIFAVPIGMTFHGWPALRIYLTAATGLYALVYLYAFVALCMQDLWRSTDGHSFHHPLMFEPLKLILTPSDRRIGSSRTAGNALFGIVLFGAGLYVSLSIPEGRIMGPIALVLMLYMSYGQSLVFSREERVRATAETELKTAHDMQMGLMPKEDPKIDGFEISGRCLPANEVGGDYFDYVWLDQKKTKLGIAIADVSGKAMKAAITAVMTSGMIYREIGGNDTPRSILKKINRPMYLKTDRQVFTALSFAVLDIKKKVLAFSNAGQTQPILLRNGESSYIKVKGARLPLGIMEEQDYKEAAIRLKRGDVLLFYTDGLPEATDGNHQLLGFEAVEEELKTHQSRSAAEIVQSMTELVSRHTGKIEQHDDMTVVVVRVL